LFLYSDHFDLEFHIQSIQEILRVADEVRIFPPLTLLLKRSPHLESVIQHFQKTYAISVQPVDYELQKGGNEMLVIREVVNMN
jgi:hypothetical protein